MFQNKIAYWADKKGYKHKHLAKECGVSAATVSSWVRNITQPDMKQTFILARILGITVDELGEFSEEENDSGEDS